MSQRPTYSLVRIADDGAFYLPVYDDPANAPQEAGSTIIVTGGGGTPYGIYSFDSDASDYVRDVRPAAEVRALAGGIADAGLVYNSSNENLGLDVQATGTVTLSNGEGTDDTGVAVDRSRHWQVWVSPQSAGDVAASLEDNGSTYVVHAEENTTSNNPDVGYALVRL